MKLFLALSALALGCVLPCTPSCAQSQQITPQDEVMAAQGKTPAPQTKSYHAGPFEVTPGVTITQEYNDNIFTERTRKTGDFITHVMPRAAAVLKGSRHALKIRGGLDQAIFADETQNDYLNGNAAISDRYSFDKTSIWQGSLSYQRANALPGDDEADPGADAGEPLPYNAYRAKTSLEKSFGGFKLTPRLGLSRYEFENVRRVNGAMLDEGSRDRDEYETGGRADYALRDGWGIFADAVYKPIDYKQSSATNHDSSGGQYLAGLTYTIGRTLKAEAGIGYLNRDYDTAAYDDIHTLGASASLMWKYGDDRQLRLNYDRSIIETTSTGTGGAVRDNIQARWGHALDDAWLLRASLRYAHTAYEGGLGSSSGTKDRVDRYYSAGLGLDYRLTEWLALTGDYEFGRTESNDNDADYSQNVFMLGLRSEF